MTQFSYNNLLMNYRNLFVILVITHFIAAPQSSTINPFSSTSVPIPIPYCQKQNGDYCNQCQIGFTLTQGKCSLTIIDESTGSVFIEQQTRHISPITHEDDVKTKTDGKYIFYLRNSASGSTLYIMDAYPAEKSFLSSSLLLENRVDEFYFNDQYLAIIFTTSDSNTGINFYDFRNRNSIKLLYEYTIQGWYTGSHISSDGFLRVVSELHQDDNSFNWFRIGTVQRQVETIHNYRKTAEEWDQNIVFVINFDNPAPDQFQVALIQRYKIDPIFGVVRFPKIRLTERFMYIFTPTITNVELIIQTMQFNRTEIKDSFSQAFVPVSSFSKDNMVINEDSGQIIWGIGSTIYEFGLDFSLRQIPFNLNGDVTRVELKFNRIYAKVDKNIVVINLENRIVNYYFVGEISEFYDIYQVDRILVYASVQNSDDMQSNRVSIINISGQNPQFISSYAFSKDYFYIWNRRGLLFQKDKHLLAIPSREYNQNNGVTYFHVERDNIVLRGIKCFDLCDQPLAAVPGFVQSDIYVQETLNINEITYHRADCQLIAVRNYNLEIINRTYLC